MKSSLLLAGAVLGLAFGVLLVREVCKMGEALAGQN